MTGLKRTRHPSQRWGQTTQGLTGPVHTDDLGSKGHGKPVEGLNSRAFTDRPAFPSGQFTTVDKHRERWVSRPEEWYQWLRRGG